MRILLLNWRDIRHPASGGAEVWAHRVAEGLVARGHAVTIFAAAVEGAPRDEMMNGVQVIRRGSRLGVYSQARRFFSKHRDTFDVILEEVNTRPFFAGRWGGIPSVVMVHQVAREVWRYEAPFPLSALGRWFFEPMWLRRLRGEKIMTLSPSSRESLLAYGLQDADVVLPGSDEQRVEFGEKRETPTVVFLGRLVRSKRPDHAIAAFSILKERFPGAEMWIMGDGPMREKLLKSLPSGVEMLGFVSAEERRRRLQLAHVLITTTVREGWGLNVSEASALGTPTIGYDSYGLRDSIPMSGGHIVKCDPNALGAALVDFFAGDLTLTPRIGTQSWESVCEQIERHLEDAIIARATSVSRSDR